MEVRIKGSYMIKPCEATREGVFSLSVLDQTGVITHVPTIYFYKPNSQDHLKSSKSFISILKNSLSQVLVHFYPLAGRVRSIGQGQLELHCNAMGVELIEAESSTQLSDLGDISSCTNQFKSLIPSVNYDKPIKELPLMLGQLTMFYCGSVSLGVTISHAIADGLSALHFMNEWARLARGEALEAAPYIDHGLIQDQEPQKTAQLSPYHNGTTIEFHQPPLLMDRENNEEERKKVTIVSILPLAKDQVESLKKATNEGLDCHTHRPYSRYEVVASHVWRSACKARGHQNEQPTCLGFTVDIRGRLHPPLPAKYFGNATVDVVASGKAGEVMTRPLGYTCGRIRRAMRQVNDEYVRSNIDFLKGLSDFSLVQDLHARKSTDGPFYGNPNIGVISWLTLPIYGLDFGWGKEIYMGPGTHDSDGDCLLLPGPENDGSVKVALCLQQAHMDDFKRYFYEDLPR